MLSKLKWGWWISCFSCNHTHAYTKIIPSIVKHILSKTLYTVISVWKMFAYQRRRQQLLWREFSINTMAQDPSNSQSAFVMVAALSTQKHGWTWTRFIQSRIGWWNLSFHAVLSPKKSPVSHIIASSVNKKQGAGVIFGTPGTTYLSYSLAVRRVFTLFSLRA